MYRIKDKDGIFAGDIFFSREECLTEIQQALHYNGEDFEIIDLDIDNDWE